MNTTSLASREKILENERDRAKGLPKEGNVLLKILLADASSTMHRAVRLALKNLPYELTCCDNGQDALRMLNENPAAILLADLDLPQLTGKELIQQVKNTPELNDVQCILLCGSFEQVSEMELEKIPADGRLWKPFEPQVLLSLLTTLEPSPRETDATQQIPTKEPERTQHIPEVVRKEIEASLKRSRVENPAPREVEKTLQMPVKEEEKVAEKPMERTVEIRSTQQKAPQDENLWSDEFSVLNRSDFSNTKEKTKTVEIERPKTPPMASMKSSFVPEKQQERKELESLVRAEVDRALSTWFKDKLNNRLQEILRSIEEEGS